MTRPACSLCGSAMFLVRNFRTQITGNAQGCAHCDIVCRLQGCKHCAETAVRTEAYARQINARRSG